jgi:hypothetical protein
MMSWREAGFWQNWPNQAQRALDSEELSAGNNV